jgi:hypothetical protein
MTLLHLACGSNRLPGWQNHDLDVNLNKPLPWGDATADRIFCEHGIEHLTQQAGFKFIAECRRILKPGGILRLAFPQPTPSLRFSDKYRTLAKSQGFDATDAGCIKMMMTGWDHKSLWNTQLACAAAIAAGFDYATDRLYGQSPDEHLRDVERHHVGGDRDIVVEETGIIEAGLL